MISALFACTGLILGSFFNVLIWRIPRGESIAWPASHCPRCNRTIKPWENIPVLSYLLLKGTCAGCHTRIPYIYPIVELLTALAAVALWFLLIQGHTLQMLTWQSAIQLSLQSFFLLLIIPLSVIDLRHYIIPDLFTIPIIFAGLTLSFIPQGITPLQSLGGILGGGGTLYLIGWLGTVIFRKGEAMGGGDIKMMAAAGALWGVQVALMGIVFGALLGSVAGVGAIVLRKLSSDHRIPFGPFLGAGLWISVLEGERILNLYMHFVENLVSG